LHRSLNVAENVLADPELCTTPLDALHRRLGGRMVPFAGYSLPVQYEGIIAEHLHCRSRAALFDVSHMGQALLAGPGAAEALERVVTGDIQGLKPGRQRYTLLMNEAGGIIDDLMVANLSDSFLLIFNASRKETDRAHIEAHLPQGVTLTPHFTRALIALQGPEAAAVLGAFLPEAATMKFLDAGRFDLLGAPVTISRSGYTGEDGFEIGLPAEQAARVAEALLEQPALKPAGLGARDSLRLEAGLCLYGNEIDESTNPIVAGLGFAIGKRRKMRWDFLGGAAVRGAHDNGPQRRLVGLKPSGRAPIRAGVSLHSAAGTAIGRVTSGGFGPSAEAPLALGYVDAGFAADGTAITALLRDRHIPVTIAPLPFVPHRYVR
jgi:aminomethyltransferase